MSQNDLEWVSHGNPQGREDWCVWDLYSLRFASSLRRMPFPPHFSNSFCPGFFFYKTSPEVCFLRIEPQPLHSSPAQSEQEASPGTSLSPTPSPCLPVLCHQRQCKPQFLETQEPGPDCVLGKTVTLCSLQHSLTCLDWATPLFSLFSPPPKPLLSKHSNGIQPALPNQTGRDKKGTLLACTSSSRKRWVGPCLSNGWLPGGTIRLLEFRLGFSFRSLSRLELSTSQQERFLRSPGLWIPTIACLEELGQWQRIGLHVPRVHQFMSTEVFHFTAKWGGPGETHRIAIKGWR